MDAMRLPGLVGGDAAAAKGVLSFGYGLKMGWIHAATMRTLVTQLADGGIVAGVIKVQAGGDRSDE